MSDQLRCVTCVARILQSQCAFLHARHDAGENVLADH